MRTWKIALVALSLLLAGCDGNGAADSGSRSSGAGSGGEASESAGRTTANAAVGETTVAASGQKTVTIEASGGDVEVRVEVADDTDEMSRGLMERTALPEDAGMLFVYPEERQLSFWMKNTLIPLSIAFMDSDGRIVDIQEMKALDDEPPHYTSAEPARYALEANEGFFGERDVEVGDRALLPV